jgi:hypothetical protein
VLPEISRRCLEGGPKKLVETSKAPEPRCHGDIEDGQGASPEKLSGEEEAFGPDETRGRNAERPEEDSPEMPGGDPESYGHFLRVDGLFQTLPEELLCGPSETLRTIDGSVSGSRLGSTAQARPEPLPFGCCSTGEEAAMFGLWPSGRTDWPAIDSGRHNPDEKRSVEAGVPGLDCPVKAGGVGYRHKKRIQRIAVFDTR